jgi:hypothetical protein
VSLFGYLLGIVLRLDIGDVQQLDRLLNAISQVDIAISIRLDVEFLSLIGVPHACSR